MQPAYMASISDYCKPLNMRQVQPNAKHHFMILRTIFMHKGIKVPPDTPAGYGTYRGGFEGLPPMSPPLFSANILVWEPF